MDEINKALKELLEEVKALRVTMEENLELTEDIISDLNT